MSRRLGLWVAPLLLLLAAFALRVYRIGDNNVWWDEGFSIVMARMPLREMAVRTAADVHPPLHYAFLHYWIRLVGASEYAVRYSTALFGVLDLALLFWLARRYLGVATAIAAVCLIAVNRLHVEWSQAMRMYTLATALVLGSTACFLRLTVDGDRRRRWWVGHLLLSVVGLHTIYIFGMAPLAQSVVVGFGWLARRVSTRFLMTWVGVQALALALFTPWFFLYRAQWRDTPAVIYPIDLLTWLRAVFTAMPVGISAYLDAWTPVTIGATLLLLWPLVRDRARRPGWLYAMSYVALLGGPVLIYGLSYPNPVMYAPNLSVRYLMLFLPMYALLLGRALVLLRPLSFVLAPALVALCAGMLLDFYSTRVLHDEYRTMTSFMSSYREPGDLAVLYSDWDWPVYQYYAPPDMDSYGVGTLDKLTAASAAALGQKLFADHHSLWLVTYNEGTDADPDGHLRRWLDASAKTLADFRVANRRLTLFTRDPNRTLNHAVPPRGRPVSVPSAPRLSSIEQPVREAQAGDVLHLATFWSTPGAVVHLELAGPDGLVYRRIADVLSTAATRGDHAIPLADRLPPGGYTVRLDGDPLTRLALLPPERPPPAVPAPPALPERHDRFGGRLELVGADRPTLEAGRPMKIRLLWQSLTAVERPYTGFLQLVGERPNPATGNAVWAQLDAPPDRDRPTNDWLPRDYAVDERSLDVPVALPPGNYELIVGLYDPADGQRLKLPDGADHARLAAWP